MALGIRYSNKQYVYMEWQGHHQSVPDGPGELFFPSHLRQHAH